MKKSGKTKKKPSKMEVDSVVEVGEGDDAGPSGYADAEKQRRKLMEKLQARREYSDRESLRYSMMMMMDRYHDPFGGHRMWGKHYRPGEVLDEETMKQLRWSPPVMVTPEEDKDEHLGIEDHGQVITDALLYILREKNNDEEKIHSVLQMPSTMPDVLESTNKNSYASSTYNILMADVSGSMNHYWRRLVDSWNEYITPYLVGRTNLFTFGTKVELKRSGTKLEYSDLDRSTTDLTGALQTVVDEVYKCKERYVKVFLITDGHHNSTDVKPTKVICQMTAAKGKTCDVFVLGAGSDFPVQYSISIRSRLHNGRANLPSLFWAKTEDNVQEQIRQIADILSGGSSRCIQLSVPGFSLPGGVKRDILHLKEWVYYPYGPETLQRLTLRLGRNICHISLEPREMNLSILNKVYRQWNSVIIQIHNKKERVPSNVQTLHGAGP
nr:uncharacterized protein LOC128684694 [Cherax quadricarinatus]